MSRPRMLSSAAVLLATVAGASWYASTLFPILKAAKADVQVSAPPAGDVQSTESGWRLVLGRDVVLRTGEVTARANEMRFEQQLGQVLAVRPITPENPIPRRTRGVTPSRPAQFSSAGVVVITRVTVDRNGAATAVVPDGCGVAEGNNQQAVCAAFSDAVSVAIRQWRYDRPAQGPIQFSVTITFRPGAEPTVTQSGEVNSAVVRETQDGVRRLAETDRDNATVQRAVASLQADLARLTDMSRELERAQRLATERLSPNHPDLRALQQQLARLNAELGRVEVQLQNMRLTGDDRARAEAQYQAALAEYRDAEQQFRSASAQQLAELREAERVLEASRAERPATGTANASLVLATPVEGSRQLVSPSGRTPLRVVPPVTAPVPITRVQPTYAALAMEARVQGTVTVEALVDERGRVADARVVKSIPLLDQSALDAAKQWEFRPALLNGETVPVLLQLEMNFTLK